MFSENIDKYECRIVNFESFDANGTHWVSYYKNDKVNYYFDSYGKIIDKLLKEIVKYLRKNNIFF